MDLVRNLPRINRSRFKVAVCTFLERGALAEQLTKAGIEVIGPFVNESYGFKHLRALARYGSHYVRVLAERLLPAALIAFGSKIKTVILSGLVRCFVGATVILRIALPIARYVRKSKVEVLHTVLPNAYVIGAIANRLVSRRPLVMSRLSLNWYHETHAVLGVIERYALHPFVDCAIGNSKAILTQLREEGLPQAKSLLVHNGIDVEAFRGEMVERCRARELLGIPQGPLVFSCIANLFPYKGHADLLNALHRLKDRVPQDWFLLLVGRDIGTNLADLWRLSHDLGLSQNIRFLGQRLDIPVILSAADIHVSASHHEGFPNNILEAMCAGLPVIGTAVGGVPELIVDGHTGLLTPARNPNELANALCVLANNPSKRRAMGMAAQLRVETFFKIDRSVAAFEEIYSALALRLSPKHQSPVYRGTAQCDFRYTSRKRSASTAAQR